MGSQEWSGKWGGVPWKERREGKYWSECKISEKKKQLHISPKCGLNRTLHLETKIPQLRMQLRNVFGKFYVRQPSLQTSQFVAQSKTESFYRIIAEYLINFLTHPPCVNPAISL